MHNQMDFFVVKSDKFNRVYIGVSGTRFGGSNHARDLKNDYNIQNTGKALPDRIIQT